MSLEEIEATVPDKRYEYIRCTVAKTLSDMPDDDQAWFAAKLVSTDTHAHISAVLRKGGYRVSQYSIGHHRRGDCTCGPR